MVDKIKWHSIFMQRIRKVAPVIALRKMILDLTVPVRCDTYDIDKLKGQCNVNLLKNISKVSG
jgi:hypothetical protein